MSVPRIAKVHQTSDSASNPAHSLRGKTGRQDPTKLPTTLARIGESSSSLSAPESYIPAARVLALDRQGDPLTHSVCLTLSPAPRSWEALFQLCLEGCNGLVRLVAALLIVMLAVVMSCLPGGRMYNDVGEGSPPPQRAASEHWPGSTGRGVARGSRA